MLVLTRRKNQVIQIGDNVRLHVVSISRHSVKLGIEAPREMPVYREEIRQRIDAERVAAARGAEPQSASDELVSA